MRKIMNSLMMLTTVSCLAATSYMALKSKKNMLDVIIEEIDSIN
jgi:hypothetical protein